MKMKAENLAKAIEICTENHSTKLSINLIPTGKSNVASQVPLVIHECCAAVVNKLIEAGFSLSMGIDGLHVADYAVKN